MASPIVYKLNVDGAISPQSVNQPVGQRVATGAANTSITTTPEAGVITNIGNYVLSNVHIDALGGSPSGDLMRPIEGLVAASTFNELRTNGKPVEILSGQISANRLRVNISKFAKLTQRTLSAMESPGEVA